MTTVIFGISYRATSARPQNTKMYMGIFALLYYIIMGIQSEPLKTGKNHVGSYCAPCGQQHCQALGGHGQAHAEPGEISLYPVQLLFPALSQGFAWTSS